MTLVEDSLGNKYCFTYNDFSIYCKEVPNYGDIKKYLIVNQVTENFTVTIDMDDIIYLACCSKSKGIILFTFSEKSWKMSEILYSHSDITLLGIYILEGYTHILYATKLPLANYYNVYHLYNRYGYWKKNNASEIFSENIHMNFSGTTADNSYIHFVNIWHDGKKYILNNNIYNSSIDKWSNKKIAALVNSNITFELLTDNSRLHLICQTYEDDISLLFYFQKKSSDNDEFNFISLNKITIGTSDYIPLYNISGDSTCIEWISENKYYKLVFDMSLREWKPQIECPLLEDVSLSHVLLIKNDKSKISKKNIYCAISNELDIQKPYIDPEVNEENEPREYYDISTENEINKNKKIDELVPYLIDQIKNLSDDVKNINSKLNVNNQSNSTDKANQKDNDPKISTQNNNYRNYKKSKFKENFTNNKITSASINTKTAPHIHNALPSSDKQAKSSENFKDAFLNLGTNNSFNHATGATYHGANKNVIAYKNPDSIQDSKISYIDPNTPKEENIISAVQNETDSSKANLNRSDVKNNNTGIFKKISDFFKQNF